MELSPGWVSAGAAIVGLVGGGLIRWVNGSMSSMKGTQKVIFEKLDGHGRDFQEYRVHVAETYVNREILKEQLAPINKALDSIQQELRDERHHKD